MERRQFIKSACVACAGMAIALPLLNGCSTPSQLIQASLNGDELQVPLTAFADKNYVIVRSKQLEFDVFVKKESDGCYKALLMRCTHRNNPVQRTSAGFVCHEHGSRFNDQGMVLTEPAVKNLTELPTTINQSHINIKYRLP
ncbi:MAG: Rieske (2Fe-2S) protein [Bacteroidetes bacterium]|nr:Rieske (2Fe-2S) protein [Bacteroidota bacterium]